MKRTAKTTVELPEQLLIQAKKRAAELRRPLRELIEAGLRTQLAASSTQDRGRRPRKIRWVTVKGGLAPDLDIADRSSMHDWLGRNR